ncbi:MAG: ABC transporter, phosphonate, periplasmic substrate-binding protein [Candidatus Methanoperedens nitroreducens]|uniref:ABC transporter, phosphonate, periplasmic substrate-binding protein n=1 Tax=Candidatus Methanoperedens nitratireducens TaxID=1392998 RepID=A0A0P8E098_9EURY|nr:phosphate/phosphite/phosphonate ABC transporter substrate-binding protein [Candidatus Methanoperedens sp. BLZ2]KAB2948468.1 MAG: phosphate/phosphite/phosphonate ABC transporter substrate-binding protein [Candidatus Methanoperedens sp.]KPQ43592.1 MAG: ABC transporter, phosphonate, periplasmic substrate-binding protein [Candidatus Methanoperedens sp. BLZ1]MBZ0174432.1 phosphate/phosphite/phosphonate ABC transporter substrate-binding protein [Candidatus Methanoperedens nitroreducens]MCX9078452.
MHPEKNVVPLLIILFVITSGCLSNEATKVNLSNRSNDFDSSSDSESLRIAVSAIISPDETLIYYQDMFDYLSLKMGVPVKLVQRKTYQEVNDLVRKNSVDAAFVCSLAYIDGKDQFGMEILAVPIVRGEPRYYSYIIVPDDSSIKSLEGLKGKTFAYTDPLSNSGKLSPEYMIAQLGENPETFFKLTFFTYSHDKSIQAVAEKMVDGAAVDSLVWDFKNATDPGFTSRTKIISKSPPYGIPPLVVSKDIDPTLKGKLGKILLQMHEDEKGIEILDRIMIDRFSEANDSLYNSVREMKKVVSDAKRKDT